MPLKPETLAKRKATRARNLMANFYTNIHHVDDSDVQFFERSLSDEWKSKLRELVRDMREGKAGWGGFGPSRIINLIAVVNYLYDQETNGTFWGVPSPQADAAKVEG